MFVGSCSEQMAIHAGTADIVFSRSTLQYMDRTLALAECLRILKPGGTLLLIENLPYNPFVNVYRLLRRLTARRPEDIGYARSIRGYLTFREIETLRSMFSTVERCEFHLCRMVTHSLAETFRNSTWLQAMDAKAAVLDEHLLTHISGMKYFSWVVSVAGKGKFRMDLPSRGDLKDDRRRVTWE